MTDKERSKSRSRRCRVCSKTFKPQRSTARYCSDACRKKAFRRRHPQPELITEPIAIPFTCEHCKRTTWQIQTHNRHYCSASCRTNSWKAKRVATAITLTQITPQVTLEEAEMMIEKDGMKAITAMLATLGYVYNIPDREWIKKQVSEKAE